MSACGHSSPILLHIYSGIETTSRPKLTHGVRQGQADRYHRHQQPLYAIMAGRCHGIAACGDKSPSISDNVSLHLLASPTTLWPTVHAMEASLF